MPTAAPIELPDDVQAVVDALRKPAYRVVKGNTLNIGEIVEAAKAEAGESEDVKRHLAMWERFRGKVDARPLLVEHRPHLRGMADDIRLWEAAKAGVNLADERRVLPSHQTPREWFMMTDAAGRIELVKIERERRAEERRFKLAKKRMASAA